MFKPDDRKQISLRLLFLFGALLGALCFVGIFGHRVLDFTNNAWLFNGDNDLRQHYIAWCRYRTDPWSFPIGLIESLSYPNSMSVIYTDSIPLFAVLFKILGPLLPVTFQYFGLFGIISFMLMGGLSAVLLARFINDPIICLMGSVFFSISFPMIKRMYYHTALAAQWIIILALIIWVYDDLIKGKIKKAVIWAGMGFLCVAIHSYFLPMVGMVLVGLILQQIFTGKRRGCSIRETVLLPLTELGGFCVAGVINLWLLGGFYGGTNASGYGLGSFESNLNTFVNPLEMGRILHRLPLFYDFQYEGFGYLGCGILYLFLVVAVGLVFRRIRKVPENAFHSTPSIGRVVALVTLCSILSASLPILTFNDKQILHVPYPEIVEKILSIFRSNGRLIWVAVYILMTAAISFAAYTMRHYRLVAIVIMAMALLLQIFDGSKAYAERYNFYTAKYEIDIPWEDPDVKPLTAGKKNFAFLYNDNDITLVSAYYGYLNGNIKQNNYYFARDIDSKVNEGIDVYMNELRAGMIRDDTVYIIKEDMYAEDMEFYNNLPLRIVWRYGHMFMAK